MEISSNHLLHFNSDNLAATAPSYPITLCPSPVSMLPLQQLEAHSQRVTHPQRMYSMSHTQKIQDTNLKMNRPKKENMFWSVLHAARNIVGEQVSKIFSSIAANANNPLSVTVVPNEGIISPDFFKGLTMRNDPTLSENLSTSTKQDKQSLNIIESVQNLAFYEKCSMMRSYDKIGTELYQAENADCVDGYSCPVLSVNYINMNFDLHSKKSETIEGCAMLGFNDFKGKEQNNISRINNTPMKTQEGQQASKIADCNMGNKLGKCEEYSPNWREKETFEDDQKLSANCTELNADASLDISSNCTTGQIKATNMGVKEKDWSVATTSNLLTNTSPAVVDGTTDRISHLAEFPDMAVPPKRPCSPRQRRKVNTIAKGRGRGRARSQLRHSGVSQTRHRKERIKHDLIIDIQDDYETWQDMELAHVIQNKDLSNFELEMTDESITSNTSCHAVSFTIADVTPRECKRKPREVVHNETAKFSAVFRFFNIGDTKSRDDDYPESDDGWYVADNNPLRPRLMSESSIDSEDSYCIVFETGSDVNCISDFEYSDTTDDDDEESDSDVTVKTPEQKVKFNLTPKIHTMIQWDYAYRAARKGPWEEMARDRERFRSRINCVENILSPILTAQHRLHVWQDRFAPDVTD